jgi:hypothetical protein
MGNRRGLWIAACLLGAGAIFWGVGQAVNPSSGDAEFNKALEAMEQVKSFRGGVCRERVRRPFGKAVGSGLQPGPRARAVSQSAEQH